METQILTDHALNQLVYNALSFATAVMLGAFVYFLTQINSVDKKYRPGIASAAVVVGIAGYHYFRIFSAWSQGVVNEGYRYADWLITVPILVVELLIVLGLTSDRRKQLMRTLVPATALMIALGYPGEVSASVSTKWTFWVLAMLPYLYILRVLWAELKAARARETGEVAGAISRATQVLLVTWLFYPIVYLFPVFLANSSQSTLEVAEAARQVGYTIADITAKAFYGLMVLGIARARSGESH